MTVAVTEPSGFASKWLQFQTAKRHVTNVKKPRKCLRLLIERKLLYLENPFFLKINLPEQLDYPLTISMRDS